jgi:hypothetical protein
MASTPDVSTSVDDDPKFRSATLTSERASTLPRKHASSVRMEALALTEVGGAEFASSTVGLDPRTVASCQLAAGAIAPPSADEAA